MFELNKLIFINVDTVSFSESYDSFKSDYPNMFKYWSSVVKNNHSSNAESVSDLFSKYSSTLPEFSKVICVSVGLIKGEEISVKTILHHDEKKILTELKDVLEKIQKLGFEMCGHNINQFHLPFLYKRYLINGIQPPSILPSYKSKPWENKVVDVKELWNVGKYNNYTTLDLIRFSMGLDDKNHSEEKKKIHQLFWNDKNFDEIKKIGETMIHSLIEVTKKLKL